ncbi:MAG TPA: leucine--tRNA ligase [Lachnospiraceae bacterium]|nr:leucine--tRNA ligase [Lachnospiraceae bacterium]
MKYNFKRIEPKWQKAWEENKVFQAVDFSPKPKWYGLVEFPYPSGAGMHVGHIKAYSSIEILSRKRRMQGYNVLFPIGFDSFGLPAENYAIKTNTHPHDITEKNIRHFTEQLKSVGFSFDWDREFATSRKDYYHWTQWIFEKLFEHGLVFRSKTLVNYCPHCKVVLSNEDSQGGQCDICHSDVVQLSKDVWFLRITQYADKLLEGLDHVDYPESIKQQEISWIGKSTGAFVDFPLDETDEKLEIYTTRCDTLYGVTFMVVAPEHPVLDKYKDRIKNWGDVEAYRLECSKKTEFERTQLAKDKTGVKIEGLAAVNPITGKKIPLFIADYVMMGYGTGAIMAVPAHDQRDYEFARKFGMDLVQVIKGGNIKKEAYSGDGEMINSGFLNGLTNKKDSIEKMLQYLAEKGIGHKGVQYKMKDWAFNRQRYWGEPIPLIHCPKCGTVLVPENELPLELPPVKNFEPGTDGQSPLAKIPEFVNCTCPKCGGPAKRETDTMPQWAGSSWYFLRFCDPHNDKVFADRKKLEYWMPVDHYNGGMEHVTRHLLYSRFWHHFLYDIGEVNTPEPYAKRTYQGMILGADGEKMSKSKGNVIDPVDIVNEYGADTLRTYVMFMGDYASAAPWSDESVKGCRRFLDRVAGLTDIMTAQKEDPQIEADLHKTIKKVSDDIENMKFNTAIAALMTLLNEFTKAGSITRADLITYIKLLSPFAPHITEEMWQYIGMNPDGKTFLTVSEWPSYDEDKTRDVEKEIGVQVNGKVRASIRLAVDCPREEALSRGKAEPNVARYLDGKTIVKEIYVPGRILNIVVK